MKVKYIHVTLKPVDVSSVHHIVYDESQFGVSDLHVISREGFLTVNYLASDGSRRGHSWPADRILDIKTTL